MQFSHKSIEINIERLRNCLGPFVNFLSKLLSRKISSIETLQFPHCENLLFRNKIFMKRATTIYLAKAVFSTYPEALTCQVNETYSTFHFENMEATSNFEFFLKRRHINPCKNNSLIS